MLHADPFLARPTLTGVDRLAAAVGRIGREVGSPAEIWRTLTENYVVDLDAVARILPRAEPEPTWLNARAEDRLVLVPHRFRKAARRA